MERVPYHHPFNKHYSLDFVGESPEQAEKVCRRHDVGTKVEEVQLDEPVWLVYKQTDNKGLAEEMDYEPSEIVAEFTSPNDVIATRMLSIFGTILRDNYEEEGDRVRAYKNLDPDLVEEALNQTDWDGSATEVAGRLASNLILKHGMPNANHRTSIGMAEAYLRQIDDEFWMPETSTPNFDWDAWINGYIERSKRLSTLRRNVHRFKWLREFGCKYVERKDGIEILLEDFQLDLQRSDAHEIYAKRHETLWIDFTETAVIRAGAGSLLQAGGLSKHEFADAINS